MFDINYPYEQDEKFFNILKYLSLQSGIVELAAIKLLREQLLLAADGKVFIMQLGDCAEKFFVSDDLIRLKQSQFVEVRQVLEAKIKFPVLIIGRIAGQYAKPRTSLYEADGKTLSYFGDIVNGFSKKHRLPNAKRMLVAYSRAKKTMHVLKSVANNFYSSHECLILPYETALTKNTDVGLVNLGAHILWLGAKSWNNQALINYLASIYNPVAVKLASYLSAADVRQLLIQLNPANRSDKLILIARIGLSNTAEIFNSWLQAVDDLPFAVTWMVDPMHANTKYDDFGVKYRFMGDMQQEYRVINDLFYVKNGYNIGMHLEASPLHDLEECVVELGGAKRRYTSLVDPRLNSCQVKDFINEVL